VRARELVGRTPALDHDHALAHLDHAAGKSLDPAVLNALEQALNTRPSHLP
jgi:HD-GYP domain-containing protein (c-di-GMP phosphodiesterase class II)